MKPVRTSDVEGDEAQGLASGEFLMTPADFRQIATMLHADAGIHLPKLKATLVYSRLIKRLRALGLKSFRDYCALVSERGGADERQQMLAALTTNVTRFFREPHHFEHLRKHVLPSLVETGNAAAAFVLVGRLSNGAEPYSIALTILSVFPAVASYDIKVLATEWIQMVAEATAGTLQRFASLAAGAGRSAPAMVHADGPRHGRQELDGQRGATLDRFLPRAQSHRQLADARAGSTPSSAATW